MGVRRRGAAGPGRDPGGGTRFLALAAVLYLAAGLLVTWPAATHLRSSFASAGFAGYGGPSPGDHLQAAYNMWLPGDQVRHGRLPWKDAYEFQPEAPERTNVAGWPLAIAFVPLNALVGPVLAWNVLALLLYVAAGLVTALWLRALDLPPPAAIVGGLAFAIAPYRVHQSVEHLLGPISILLPAALLAFERRRYVLAGLALASIPLSGQVHLALGAIPFYAAYVVARRRDRKSLTWCGGAVIAAVAAGLLVQRTTIKGSIADGARTLHSVDEWSAHVLDLLWREERGNPEQFAYLGWLTPLAAIAGLVLLWRRRDRALAAVFGLGAVIPAILALGTNTPLYEPLWHVFPPLHYPRVPERMLPVACLCIAALAAVAVARIEWRWAAPLAAVLVAVDLATFPYEGSAADPGNRAYAALPSGRVLELPVFRPGIHYGSVYQYYAMQTARERPSGYSTTAERSADAAAKRLRPLNCGDWSGGAAALLREFGITAIVVHQGLFEDNPYAADTRSFAEWQLARHGWRPAVHDGAVTLWLRGRDERVPPLPGAAVRCGPEGPRWTYRDGGWRLTRRA
jgi:hypothetical protein